MWEALGSHLPKRERNESKLKERGATMQLMEFPQDVNSEPHNEMEALLFEALTTVGDEPFSEKQAHWLIAVFRGCEWNPQAVAYAIAVVTRGGPDLAPFEASDEDLIADAKEVFDGAVAALLRANGGLQ